MEKIQTGDFYDISAKIVSSGKMTSWCNTKPQKQPRHFLVHIGAPVCMGVFIPSTYSFFNPSAMVLRGEFGLLGVIGNGVSVLDGLLP